MEARGLISGYDGSKPRQVLISKEEWQEIKMGGNNSVNADESQDDIPVKSIAENVDEHKRNQK